MRQISPNIFEFHMGHAHALGESQFTSAEWRRGKKTRFVNMKMQLIHFGDQKRKAKANDEIKTAND